MNKIWIQINIVIIGIMLCIIGHLGAKKYVYNNFINKEVKLVYNDNKVIHPRANIITTTVTTTTTTTTTSTTTSKKTTKNITTSTKKKVEDKLLEEIKINKIEKIEETGEIIFDDMTLTELTNKLNKSLNSTLSNTGIYFATYYKEKGLDPYLALAIVLHETGCKWTCSKLVRECNNIGGMKGTPSCNGGSYMKYDTLEEGINGYLDMLYNNYYSKGLNTPELINPKYASSTTWSEKINNYILEIKAK